MRTRSLLRITLWSSLLLLGATSCDQTSKFPLKNFLSEKTTTAQTVGYIDGSFAVNANGSSTYIVPILTPPGTNKIAPDLALTYDSSRGNGYVGMGWSLNGISAITRCGRKQYIDGVKGGVRLDANDRFCLDGIRLVLVSGTEGGDGAVYRTEKETWTQVTAHGVCGSGPCSFTAVNKDGATLTFGVGDSQILANNNPSVLVWSAKRFTDLDGNFTEVSYTINRDAGEYYPSEIHYTGNDAQNFSPSRKIQFVYETRPDTSTDFVAGAQTGMSQRLSHIQTSVQGSPVLDYQLGYQTNAITNTSRLATLTLCDGSGTCLPATTFSWQDAPYSFTSPTSANTNGLLLQSICWDGGRTTWSDLNGDGLADFHCDNNQTASYAGQHWAEFSVKNGLISANQQPHGLLTAAWNPSGWCSGPNQTSFWSDVDGNGLPDLHCNDSSNGQHFVIFTTLSGNNAVLNSRNINSNYGLILNNWCWYQVSSMDFNGDGLADLGCYDQKHGNHWVMLSTGSSYVSPTNDPNGNLGLYNWCPGDNGVVTWSDFDGDGKSDLHCFDQAGKNHYVMLSTGNGIVPANTNNGGTNGYVGQTGQNSIGSWGDFNGDGLVDFLTSSVDSSGNIVGDHSVFYSNGRNLMGAQTIAINWCQGQKNIVWADVNGDGRADMDCYQQGSPYQGVNHWLQLSGYSTVTDPAIGPSLVPVNGENGVILNNWCDGASQISWGDFNGDGLADIFCDNVLPLGNGGRGQHYVMAQQGPKSDLITGITNGFNGTIQLSYSTLTDPNVYQKISESTYPVEDIQNGHTVVAQQINSDGRGNSYTYQYQYAGAKSDMQGRGWLGFKTMAILDLASSTKTVTTFNQTSQNHGTVAGSQVTNGSGQILGTTATTYQITATVPGNSFVVQVLPNDEKTGIYENGVLAYTLEKQFGYDAFGNMNLLQDLGDNSRRGDELYTCMSYVNDALDWRLGYLQNSAVTQNLSTCQQYLQFPNVLWMTGTLTRKQYTYDASMNLKSESQYDDPHSAWLTLTYAHDGFGNKISITDPSGNTTTYAPDATFHTFIATTTTPPNQNGAALTTSAVFEPNFGQLTSMTDPNGNTIQRNYDTFGRLSEIWLPNPSGTSEIVSKIAWGQDGTGFFKKEMSKEYWGQNNSFDQWSFESDYFDGMERSYRSQTVGLPQTPPSSRFPKLTQTPDGTWSVNEDIIFDASGRVWKESLPYFITDTPYYIATTYDDHNRPTQVTLPDGTTKKIAYDMIHKKVTSTEAYGTANAQTTLRILNSRGKTISKILPNGLAANFVYDPLQRLTTTIDPYGISATYVYDSIGRLSSTTDPDRGHTTYQYDNFGHFQSKTDAEGQTVSYTYDRLGRMLTKTLQTSGSTTQSFSYVYDDPAVTNGKGNLTQYTDSNGPVTAYAYDNLGQIANVRKTIGGKNYVFGQTYDPQGRQDTFTFPDGLTQRDFYGPSGLTNQINLYATDGTATNYAQYTRYDAQDKLLGATHGTGPGTINYGYTYYPLQDQTNTLASVSLTRQNQNFASINYGWNHLRNLVDLQTVFAPNTSAPVEYFTYDASNMGFLTQARGAYGVKSYNYNTIGGVTNINSVTYSYAPGTHQIQSGSDGSAYTYFKNGALKAKTAGGTPWNYAYNAELRLTAASQNNTSVNQYQYDDDGTRVQKTDANNAVTWSIADTYEVTTFSDGSAQYTKYVLGPDGVIATITASGFGDTQSSSQLGAFYDKTNFLGFLKFAAEKIQDKHTGIVLSRSLQALIYLGFAILFFLILLRRWQTQTARSHPILARLIPVVLFFFTHVSLSEAALTPGQNGSGIPTIGTVFFHTDHLGSTIALTDASGNLVTTVGYLPYGLLDQDRSSGPDIFRPKFGGKEYDSSTGNYYFAARYYDPALGVFTTPDPARQTYAPYTYAGDNPMSAIDPDGEFFFVLGIIVVGALVGAYMGGAAVNHDFNPLHWNWRDGKTYLGLVGGGAIGGVASLAGLAVVAGAGAIGGTTGIAVGIAGEMFLGAGENAAFAAMGGGSGKEVLTAAAEGALFGGILGGAGIAAGVLGRRIGSRLVGDGTEAIEEGVGEARTIEREAEGLCSSFAGNTEVLSHEGWKPIEDIEKGDSVLSWNERSQKTEWKPVIQTFRHMAGDLVAMTVDETRLLTTAQHPFLSQDRHWTASDKLRKGDSVATLDDINEGDISWSPIASLEKNISEDTPALVHNFAVDGNHNYFVSDKAHADAVLAHNSKCQLNKKNNVNQHLDARKIKRPSWKSGASGVRSTLIKRQTTAKGLVRSAVRSLKGGKQAIELPSTAKTPWGTTAWQIDHVISYKYLWKASRYAKTAISDQTFRDISNDLKNLRLLQYNENMSHSFEIADKVVGIKTAKAFLAKHYGVLF